MTYYPRSETRTPAILKYHQMGLSIRDIAARVGCGESNVTYVIRHRAGGGRMMVGNLPPDKLKWLHREAKANGVRPAEMARALLVDAISDAQEAERAKMLAPVYQYTLSR